MPTYNGKDRKDVMIRQIREAIAEETRKDIIERLWKGRQERVRKGQLPGGNLPYGLQRNGKAPTLHLEEAEIVKTIFELAALGKRSSTIAVRLTDQAFRMRNGKPWTRRQVSAILQRKAFYQSGVVHYGDTLGQNPALIIAVKEHIRGQLDAGDSVEE